LLILISKIFSSSISLLVASLILFLTFGGLFYVDGVVKKNTHDLQTLSLDAERILNSDLSGTTAVRLSASLQSDRYIMNYQDIQDTKYALIEDVAKFRQSETVRQAFSKMEEVQQDIEDAESEAIAQIDDENWEEALELVTEPAFRRQKGIYRANLSKALREMLVDSQKQAAQSASLAQFAQIVAMVMFLILALIGVMYSRKMRLTLERQSQLALNLEDANENLEQRVNERTAELKKSQSLFKTVLDNMPAVVFLKTKEGQFQLINSRYEEAYGVSFDDVKDKSLHDLFPADLADELQALDQAAIENGAPSESEHNKIVDGEDIVLSSVLCPHSGSKWGHNRVRRC